MKILTFGPESGRPLTAFDSHAVTLTRVLRESQAHAVVMHLAPGGVVGHHPATETQLFMVVEGEGWVRSGEEKPVPIRAGLAAFWEAGEFHQSGTERGMIVLVIEGPDLAPALPDSSTAGEM